MAGVRLAVGRMPTTGDYVVDRLDGPRRIPLRDESDEVMRFKTHDEAAAHLSRVLNESGSMGACPIDSISSSAKK